MEPWRAFGPAFFARWQWLLVGALDTPLVGRWLRWVLRIRPCDVGYRARIVRVLPHAYIVEHADHSFTLDVRSHWVFAQRMYHAFKWVWWTCHAWDLLIAQPLVPALDLGFATLTAYPDADPETTTVDGQVGRFGVNETWSTIRAGAGNSANDSATASDLIFINASSTTNQWQANVRGLFLFDTSALTSAANISAAQLSLYVNIITDNLVASPNADIYTATPASNTALAATDYSQVGSTSQTGSPRTFASMTASAYNAFTFNATGIGNVSKTGVSKFGIRNANFDVANVAPAWVSGSFSRIQVAMAGSANPPKLEITYTVPVAALTGVSSTGSVGTMVGAATDRTLRFVVEMELSGRDNGWTDVTGDVLRYEGITASGGMTSGNVTERIAATGEMTFALNNSAQNSAHLLGYYSPGHTNCRAGFSIGIGVRWRASFDVTTKTLFTGRVDIIKPVAGQYGSRRTFVTAVDYMDELAQAKLHGLPVQINQYPGDVFTTVVNSLPRQPRALEVDQGVDQMAYSLDSARDESQTAMEEAAKLAASEHGFVYPKGDGTLTFEGRSRRAQNRVNLATFVDLTALDLTYQRDRSLNDVQVTVHPKRADTVATTVLASLQSATKLVPGQTFTWLSPYRDPQQIAARVGGTDMVTPVATTDYVMNGAQDGSGADLTAFCTIVANFGGNGARLEVTNTGTVEGWIGGTAGVFQVRGRGLYDFENVILEEDDETAQANIGVVTVGVDMPYQSRLDVGAEIALYVLQTQTAAFASIDRMAFVASTDTLKQQLVLREIGDRIGIQEVVTGIDTSGTIPRGYYIQGKRYQLVDNVLSVEYALAISDSTAYWLLEIQGFSELDLTTRLGFGLIIGHIDIAHQDSAPVSHDDVAHGDVPHGDALHLDASHGDIAHTDTAHGDTAHSDVAHSDTAHTDTAHVDSSRHDDHNDSMGGHNDTGGGRTHTDTAHGDTSHGDQAHGDFGASYNHTDGASHIDVPNHTDGYEHFDGGSYSNNTPFINVAFVNVAHGDNTHEDFADTTSTAHGDVAHVDTHGDSAHVDSAHADVAHTDNNTHGDQAAQNTAHTDTAHHDVAAAEHGDSPHGDAN